MEFLRFGSSIPGGYWGCCAVCIIQNFKYDPSDKASIELLSGDGGCPMIGSDGGPKFAGPTYEDIFKTRLRIGTFSDSDMPNHVFLAVLTESQISGGVGKKWLSILKREGFEFIRTTDNSVYNGPDVDRKGGHPHRNYVFGLFRNIGYGRVTDPFKAPDAWTALDDPYKGDMTPKNMGKVQRTLWDALGKPKFLTEAQVREAGAPVTLAGRRLPGAAPETKEVRDARTKQEQKAKGKKGNASLSAGDPFAVPA